MRATQKISNTTRYNTRQGKGITLVSEVNVLLAFSFSNWAYEQRIDHFIKGHGKGITLVSEVNVLLPTGPMNRELATS